MIALSLQGQFLGPASELLQWMQDPEVTDILINGKVSAFVERRGVLESVPCPFSNTEAVYGFLERVLLPLGKRVDALMPCLDGKLADGSRFHVILPPLAPQGPYLSIRKRRAGREAPLESFGPFVHRLREDFGNGKSILISGGTGTGKTTLLSRLLDTVPSEQRIVVVEETPEIRIDHPHAVFLEARSANPEGTGEVSLRALIRNALRMRPDRLVLGECRGGEAWDLLYALNSGHSGSASTIHASHPVGALRRLETLLLMSGEVPLVAAREWIAGAIQVVVQLERRGNARLICEVVGIQGLEGDRYRLLPHSVDKAPNLCQITSP